MLKIFFSIFQLMERSNSLHNIEIVALQNIAAGKRRTSVVSRRHSRACQKNQQFFCVFFLLIIIIILEDHCMCMRCVRARVSARCVCVCDASEKQIICVTHAVFFHFMSSSFIYIFFLHIFFFFNFLCFSLLFLFATFSLLSFPLFHFSFSFFRLFIVFI